jgi:hypothetical protein
VSNYIGLRNRFGILGEAFAYATFQDRTLISRWFVEAILDFASGHAGEIRARTEAADARSLVGDSLSLRATFQRSSAPVSILMGEVVEERNPFSGEIMLRRTDVQTPTEMYEYGTFSPTEKEMVAAAYLLPPGQRVLLERLEAHGIRSSVLPQETSVEVQEFLVDSVTTSPREYEGHQEQTAFGGYRTVTATLERGTVVVRLDQPLARVAFGLLEPRSDDGFVAWGFLTDELAAGKPYPVTRVSSQGLSALSSRLPPPPDGGR